MMEHGESGRDLAYAMFDQSIRDVLLVAMVVAIIASVALAVVLSRMIARPLAEVGAAARRVAGGDLGSTRAPGRARRAGQPGRLVQPDGRRARGERAPAPRHHRQHRARAAHAADQPGGLPRGHPRWRHRARPAAPTNHCSRRPSAWSAWPARSMTWPSAIAAAQDGSSGRCRPGRAAECRRRAGPTGLRGPPPDPRAPLAHEPLPARADPDQFAQVLANLLQNAARYAPEGGTRDAQSPSSATTPCW